MPENSVSNCPECTFVHSREGCPPPELVAGARAHVAASSWTFASTMPRNPHYYVVFPFARDDGPDDEAERDRKRAGFRALRDLIVVHGWDRTWHGHVYRTVGFDGFDYWFIWPVINRKPSDRAGWDADPKVS